MAEIHNIQDLQIIQILFREHTQIREILEDFPAYYDPTESLVDVLRAIVSDVRLVVPEAIRRMEVEKQLRREISYLKSEIDALRMEKNSEKIDSFGRGPGRSGVFVGVEGKNSLRQGPDHPARG